MALTIEPIKLRGHTSIEKLKRYAKDPDVFVMYNVHKYVAELYSKSKNPDYPAPVWDECYRVKPLSMLYEKTLKNSRGPEIAAESLCLLIDNGSYILFRIMGE